MPEVERFSRVALAVDAFRKKDYTGRRGLAEAGARIRPRPADHRADDRLGQGRRGRRRAARSPILDKLQGPEWYSIFTTYHRALIAEQAGLEDKADKAYKAALDDVAAGGAAPETWLRAAEAYAGFLMREGKKDEALDVLDQSDEFSAGRAADRRAAQADRQGASRSRRWSTGPSTARREVLLDLGTALNRGGGEAFVRLYLQYALALEPNSDVVLMQLASVAEQQERCRRGDRPLRARSRRIRR